MRSQCVNISVGLFFGTTRRGRSMVSSNNRSTVRYPCGTARTLAL